MSKRKVFTQQDVDAFGKIMPKGHYATCKFGNNIKFAAGSTFAPNTVFGYGCNFLSNCIFGYGSVFGSYSKFGKGCRFEAETVIGQAANLGNNIIASRLTLGPNSVVGANCTFGPSSVIQSCCRIGQNFSLGEFSVVHDGAEFQTAEFGNFSYFYGTIEFNDNATFGASCSFGNYCKFAQSKKFVVCNHVVKGGPVVVSCPQFCLQFFDTDNGILVVSNQYCGLVDEFLEHSKKFGTNIDYYAATVRYVRQMFATTAVDSGITLSQPLSERPVLTT